MVRLFGISLTFLLWSGVAAAQILPVPDAIGVKEDKKMFNLESAASSRSLQAPREVNTKEYSTVVSAAHVFASGIAGDNNHLYTELASDALTKGLAAKRGTFFNRKALNDGQPSRVEQIWGKPAFQQNFRKLMDLAAKPDSGLIPISGPPSEFRIVGPGTQVVSDPMFKDCVCVGRRVGGVDQFCCTGTLIGKNVVVTAGHCFFCTGGGSNSAVVFFGTNTNDPGARYTGKAIRHPDYGLNGLHNDLAVIILDQDVTGAIPRRIATAAELDGATFVRAVGFGNSDFSSSGGFGVKRMVDVPLDTTCCCNGAETEGLGCDQDLELVAGFVGLGPDSCNGDSGGPVYVLTGTDAREDASWAVAGATSRATDLATRPCGDGGIYARLEKFEAYIRSIPDARF